MALYSGRIAVIWLILPLALFAKSERQQELPKGRPFPVELPPWPPSLGATQPCIGSCSLSQWATKIRLLKERPIQLSTLPLKKNYQKSILSLQEYLDALHTAARTIARATCANKAWLGGESLYASHPELYTLDCPLLEPAENVKNFPFEPYTRRLVAQPGSKIIMFGDLHGSIHSFIRDLEKLRDEGFINDAFTLTKSNSHMVFLGDYIDRGIYGTEVVYTLARLIIANPTRVIVVRGNHEDYNLASDFRKKHTKEEEKDTAPNFIDELYRKFDLSLKDEISIFRFYGILPLALYLGCGTTHHTDFIQCCHGGIEIGYTPYALLTAPKEISFERITTLWRKNYFAKKLDRSFRTMITKGFAPDVLREDLIDIKPDAPIAKVGTAGHMLYNGFLWNDFYVDPFKTVGQRGKKFSGWVSGKKLTHKLLSWGNSKNVALHGIVRAHQHNNETGGPMLNLLCCSRGFVDIWQDQSAYTLVSAPDSKLEDTGEECFTYDCFVIITVASSFKEWQIAHYWQDIGMEKRAWRRRQIFLGQKPRRRIRCPLNSEAVISKALISESVISEAVNSEAANGGAVNSRAVNSETASKELLVPDNRFTTPQIVSSETMPPEMLSPALSAICHC